jgi:hypothetical protein
VPEKVVRKDTKVVCPQMVYPNFDRGDNFNPKYVWRAYLPVFYVILMMCVTGD